MKEDEKENDENEDFSPSSLFYTKHRRHRMNEIFTSFKVLCTQFTLRMKLIKYSTSLHKYSN
jgi:hypothetical protein